MLKKCSKAIRANLKVAGSQGFEPRQTVPKTVVLPLHHEPIKMRDSKKTHTLVNKKCLINTNCQPQVRNEPS